MVGLKINNMEWYIVRAQANRERKVSERLLKEGEKGELSGVLGRVVVPLEKVFATKNGKKTQREKVLFPGYVFVETSAIGELKQVVKKIDGATGLLSDRAGNIQVIPENEVSRMIGLHEENKAKEFTDIFSIGDEVTVAEGPFASFKGNIEHIDKERGKIKVNVLIFGRPTSVELEDTQIRK
jgi:transcriptional antiterminator NusG